MYLKTFINLSSIIFVILQHSKFSINSWIIVCCFSTQGLDWGTMYLSWAPFHLLLFTFSPIHHHLDFPEIIPIIIEQTGWQHHPYLVKVSWLWMTKIKSRILRGKKSTMDKLWVPIYCLWFIIYGYTVNENSI